MSSEVYSEHFARASDKPTVERQALGVTTVIIGGAVVAIGTALFLRLRANYRKAKAEEEEQLRQMEETAEDRRRNINDFLK